MYDPLVQSNTQLARLTNQYERAKQDVNHLKTVQARLEKERDILTRQTSGSGNFPDFSHIYTLYAKDVHGIPSNKLVCF